MAVKDGVLVAKTGESDGDRRLNPSMPVRTASAEFELKEDVGGYSTLQSHAGMELAFKPTPTHVKDITTINRTELEDGEDGEEGEFCLPCERVREIAKRFSEGWAGPFVADTEDGSFAFTVTGSGANVLYVKGQGLPFEANLYYAEDDAEETCCGTYEFQNVQTATDSDSGSRRLSAPDSEAQERHKGALAVLIWIIASVTYVVTKCSRYPEASERDRSQQRLKALPAFLRARFAGRLVIHGWTSEKGVGSERRYAICNKDFGNTGPISWKGDCTTATSYLGCEHKHNMGMPYLVMQHWCNLEFAEAHGNVGWVRKCRMFDNSKWGRKKVPDWKCPPGMHGFLDNCRNTVAFLPNIKEYNRFVGMNSRGKYKVPGIVKCMGYVGHCFPATAQVRLQDGTTKTLEELGPSDLVETTADFQERGYERWLFDFHGSMGARQAAVVEDFVEFVHESEPPLRITPNHFLYVLRDGEPSLVLAGSVVVGDVLLVTTDAGVKPSTISSLRMVSVLDFACGVIPGHSCSAEWSSGCR